MIVSCASPIVGEVQTAGLVSANAVAYDVSSSALFPAMNGCQIFATVLLIGYTTAGDTVRFMLRRTFERTGGTLSAPETPAVLIDTFASAALLTVTADLDFTGNTIRGLVNGIPGETIEWTGALWFYTTPF